MKIVLDTNVLVSGFLNPPGAPARILGLLLEGRLTLCLDPRILAEYRQVLSRPEWSFKNEDVQIVLETLSETAVQVHAAPVHVAVPDPFDVMFLETAVTARAHALVTGNKRHFPKSFNGIPVLSPSEFLEFWSAQTESES